MAHSAQTDPGSATINGSILISSCEWVLCIYHLHTSIAGSRDSSNILKRNSSSLSCKTRPPSWPFRDTKQSLYKNTRVHKGLRQRFSYSWRWLAHPLCNQKHLTKRSLGSGVYLHGGGIRWGGEWLNMVQQQSKEGEEGIQRKTRGNVRNTVVRNGGR